MTKKEEEEKKKRSEIFNIFSTMYNTWKMKKNALENLWKKMDELLLKRDDYNERFGLPLAYSIL